MKIYYFTIISVGLMFLLSIAGIETNSSKIISSIGSPENWNSGFLWVAVLIAITSFIALTNRISAAGFSIQASTESIVALFVLGIYVVFVSDLYSVVLFAYSITHSSSGVITADGWAYYMIWFLIIPLLAGYTIALIEFIRGVD